MSNGTAAAPAALPEHGSVARLKLAHAARVAGSVSPADALLIQKMKSNGISMPLRCLIAARSTKLPLALACALLEQESGGGANVFGHDPTIFAGAGEVTKEKYLAYKAQRGPTGHGGMQGVGPCQLTWYSYQDEADKLGGCWAPLANMKVGFARLSQLVRQNGLHAGMRAYNGAGPAAEAYAASVQKRYDRWQGILAEKPEAPKKIVINPASSWKKHVYGDTDCHRDLLVKLASVAKDLNVKVQVRSGNRTFAEQAVLYEHYQKFGKPLAAKPGHSNHEGGRAADCGINGANIGDVHGARAAMKKYGLCLPVKGETWHVEVGTTWNN